MKLLVVDFLFHMLYAVKVRYKVRLKTINHTEFTETSTTTTTAALAPTATVNTTNGIPINSI